MVNIFPTRLSFKVQLITLIYLGLYAISSHCAIKNYFVKEIIHSICMYMCVYMYEDVCLYICVCVRLPVFSLIALHLLFLR